MRNPPVAEILNEEISNLLKRKIKGSVSRLDELGISFDYEGEVTARDAEEILAKIRDLHARSLAAARAASGPRADALNLFSRRPAQGVLRFRARFLPARPVANR